MSSRRESSLPQFLKSSDVEFPNLAGEGSCRPDRHRRDQINAAHIERLRNLVVVFRDFSSRLLSQFVSARRRNQHPGRVRYPENGTPRQSEAATGLRLRVNFGTGLRELCCLLFQSFFDRCFFRDSLLCSIAANIFDDLHAAEVRTAHRTEVRSLCAFGWESFVVELARSLRIEREIELVLTNSPRPANSPSRVTLNVIYPVAPFATVFPTV